MRSETVEFARLPARLDLPEPRTRAYAVLAHGSGETAPRVARALTGAGFAVLRFDVTDRDATDDVLRAVDWLRTEHGPASLLVGHATGAAAVRAVAGQMPDRPAVAAIAPETMTLSANGAESVIALSDLDLACAMLATWAAHHLPAPEPAERVVVVSENGDGPFGQQISASGHALTADEPRPVGANTGPNPYDLLLAALGACTSMTLRMYAERKKLALDHVSVTLRHSRIHAKDCENCETQAGMIDHIDRTVHLHGDLDDDQRRRLLEIADKCPVHRTLHSEIEVSTTEGPRGHDFA